MAQKLSPMLPKRGTIRFLALIFIFLISCTPASEIRAKPIKTSSEQIIPAIHEFANTAVPSELLPPKPADSTGAVALDEPKPKIDPQLVEELKELKRQKKHQRVRILLEATDEESLEKIREAVQKAGGKIEQNFDIGDISVIEVQSDKVEELSEVVGVEQISTEKEYVAFLQDRIPAFSIDTVWSNNITGKNVKIAILDTGVGPHDAINVAAAESFVSGEDTADQNGHGTHVAGIAQGIAKDALIYNAKVLNKNGGGTTSQILAGINWAVQQDADIISMSFGGMFTELDGPLASAVKEAIQNGVVFVVASGNCKQGCGGFYGVTTPGNVKEVITVGAVDDNNVVASFSSGDTFDGYIKPDVVAPGIDITSAWLNNGQKTLSGTSMSAPFVAGMTALLLEKEPGLTHEQVKERLESTATDMGDAGKDERYGSGLVNSPELLQSGLVINQTIQNSTTTSRTRLSPSELLTYVLTNYTVLFEEENRGSYQYTTIDGDTVIVSFSISKPENSTNITTQMLLPSEVEPSDSVPVILEFLAGDRPPQNELPTYLTFEIRDSSDRLVRPLQAFTFFPSFLDLLYAADPNDIVTIDIIFTAPSSYATYTAYAYIWNNVEPDHVMIDIDAGGKNFDVVANAAASDDCDSDSDCPDDRWRGGTFCKNGDIYQDFRDWYCVGPNTKYSSCNVDTFEKKKEECGNNICSNDQCVAPCQDADNDGIGTNTQCPLSGDCDDNDAAVYPGAPEICDGKDNNCILGIDEDLSDNPELCSGNYDDNCNGYINENCPCEKNSGCAAGMTCEFKWYSGTCQPLLCTNQCTPGTYTCSSGSIYECKDGNGDGCTEQVYKTFCGRGRCQNGQPACLSSSSVVLKIEESEGSIYAQPGDIITVNLIPSGTQSVQLEYSSIFSLDTSTCSSNSFSISNAKQCKFQVSKTATYGRYYIGINGGDRKYVSIKTEPSLLILTNKEKLRERYNDDYGVNTLLKQAYAYAGEHGGVVYDLFNYMSTSHPWNAFELYKETYKNQEQEDNTYSLEVSEFVQDKCNKCTSTLILGDDFVVPHYRRKIDISTWFGFSEDTQELYSDLAYIQRTTKEFSEFEELFYQSENFDGKNVLIVLPDNVDAAKREQINRLTSFLENHPEIQADVNERNGNDAECNSRPAFSYYDGYTVIVLGTENTNRALQCFPFVIENSLETLTIERNPWDGRAYSVVVNSDNTDVLTLLNDILEKETYKELHSSGWLVARTAGNVITGVAIGTVVVASGGTASFALLAVGTGASVATDAIDGAECLKFAGGQCTEFAIGLLLPFGLEKIGKPALNSAIDVFGPQLRYVYEALGENTIGFLKRMGKKGQLNTDSGLAGFMAFMRSNDNVGDAIPDQLIKLLTKSGDEFRTFILAVAKNDPGRATRILSIAHSTKLSAEDLRKIASQGGIPANMFIKSIDDLDDSFKLILEGKLTYSNGMPRPAFRGISEPEIADALGTGDPNKVISALEAKFNEVGASKGFDIAHQIEIGGGSELSVSSFSHDFGVATSYAINKKEVGIVLVFDKRLAAFVDSQDTLRVMDTQIPRASVDIPGSRSSTVESVYGTALHNNELNLLGKPQVQHVVGWYEIRKMPDGSIAKKFVQNPKYVGKQAEWGHINTIDKLQQLHNDNDIANYQRITDWLNSKPIPQGESAPEPPDFDLMTGNTDFWPPEVP